MRKILTVAAAALMVGSAWAGQDGQHAGIVSNEHGGILSWDADRDNLNYSESNSTAFHRDFLAERDTSIAGQPGVGDSMVRGDTDETGMNRDSILSWDNLNYSESGSPAFHRDFDDGV
jgi:hypothetical protein